MVISNNNNVVIGNNNNNSNAAPQNSVGYGDTDSSAGEVPNDEQQQVNIKAVC